MRAIACGLLLLGCVEADSNTAPLRPNIIFNLVVRSRLSSALLFRSLLHRTAADGRPCCLVRTTLVGTMYLGTGRVAI